MIVKYIDRAMSKAVYDKLDDGSFSGKIPQCPGVIAFGETLYQCEQELKASLEGWLIVKLRHGDKLPVINEYQRLSIEDMENVATIIQKQLIELKRENLADAAE
jgi:predicted RNase H-like HicB family nuclease